MVPEVIRTARAILRPYRSSDVEDVLAYAADPDWGRYLLALTGESYTRLNGNQVGFGSAL